MALFGDIDEYLNHMVERLRLDLAARRREDRALHILNVTSKAHKGVLAVDKVSFYPKNNGVDHRTIRYELVHRQPETAVFRRGLPFSLVIRFADGRSFDIDQDILRLNFNFGPAPSVLKHTQGILVVEAKDEFSRSKDQWDVRVQGKDKDSINLQVQIPPDVPVGIWRMQILSGDKRSPDKLKLYDCPIDIYILFNPWCEDDGVHMEGDDECHGTKLLDEYVLADVGKIYMGSYGSARGREWVFGQYDDATLPVCVYLLERTGLAHADRSDPILVSRALSKMVNANDDGGVLVGRWDDKYEDGTSPSTWTGSVKILEDYLLTRKPVKYGQCWVFAGVLTTLGLPARPVTNLVSAHDANGTLTIDKYYDSKNIELGYDPFNPSGGNDSVWNFHVWVEAWMARPDLPRGYGGWQAIDATPQERSSGFFQCGPASVEAVKNGEIGLAYDVTFILSEVNADLVRWREDKKSEIGFVQIDTNQYHIGRQILTKKPNVFDSFGQSDMEDITNNYKSSEGTQEERINLYNAVRSCTRAKRFFQYPPNVEEDVVFDLVELERVPIGEPFNVTVTIKNRSPVARTVNTVLSATTNFYNGVKAHEVRRAVGCFILQPKSTEELRLPVSSQDYLGKLVEYGMMKLHAAASVKETNQSWVEEDDFQVLMPKIDIAVNSKSIQTGKELEVAFKLENSLKMRLTQCKLCFEGPGLTRAESRDVADLSPGEVMRLVVKLTPKFAGDHNLVATFHSKQFTAMTGSARITVGK